MLLREAYKILYEIENKNQQNAPSTSTNNQSQNGNNISDEEKIRRRNAGLIARQRNQANRMRQNAGRPTMDYQEYDKWRVENAKRTSQGQSPLPQPNHRFYKNPDGTTAQPIQPGTSTTSETITPDELRRRQDGAQPIRSNNYTTTQVPPFTSQNPPSATIPVKKPIISTKNLAGLGATAAVGGITAAAMKAFLNKRKQNKRKQNKNTSYADTNISNNTDKYYRNQLEKMGVYIPPDEK